MNSKSKILLIVLLLIIFSIIIIIITKQRSTPRIIKLTFWGYDVSPQIMNPIIESFERQNPNFKLTYYQKDFNNYYTDLISAFANQQAPDIFMLPGNWLPLFEDHLAPLNLEKDKDYNLKLINDTYPSIINEELVNNNYLLGIPLSIDTLALYYNPALLKDSNITKLPNSWSEIYQLVPKLRKVNKQGQITRAAIALGASNVNWQTDILSNLMLQLGSNIVDKTTKQFTILNNSKINIIPGISAFEEYAQFANPKSSLYTWNKDIANSSLKAFSDGKVAMILAYANDAKFINQYSPDLSYKIYPFPSIIPSVFYGRTTNLVVNKTSKNYSSSWAFLKYFATKDISSVYQKLTNQPPARLDLIQESLNNPFFNVFVSQTLLSKSWYQFNYQIINDAFDQIVTNLTTTNQNTATILGTAIDLLEQKWRQSAN